MLVESTPLATRAKLAVRNMWSCLLGWIPLTWFDGIRRRYAGASPGFERDALQVLLNILRYRQPDFNREFFCLPDSDLKFVIVNSLIVRQLYWYGLRGYEGPEVRLWQRACRHAHAIVEMGANIGIYTVCGANAARGVSYVAVEPHPCSSTILKKNITLNELDHVQVLAAAVVGRKTTETMRLIVPEVDQDETPTGAFLQLGGEMKKAAFREHEVPVVEARELIRGKDLIKLDVEGYEYEILSSVQEDIIRDRPVIFTELLTRSTRLRQWVVWLCQEHGFQAYVCVADGAKLIGSEAILKGELKQQYGTRDVLLVGSETGWLRNASRTH
jgi:FkbM family methyltransferase